MSDERNTVSNGEQPAFPNELLDSQGGLTKREYFAAMAMQGILAGRQIASANAPKEAVKFADELLNWLES